MLKSAASLSVACRQAARPSLPSLMMGLLLLILAPGCAFSAAADEATSLPECCRPKPAEAPRALAVVFRTEGCEACRILEPAIARAADEFTSSPVLFVTLDFTTPHQSKQSEYLARALGLDEMWKNFARQSGFVLVLDGATRRPLAKITHYDSSDVLIAEIRKALVR